MDVGIVDSGGISPVGPEEGADGQLRVNPVSYQESLIVCVMYFPSLSSFVSIFLLFSVLA